MTGRVTIEYEDGTVETYTATSPISRREDRCEKRYTSGTLHVRTNAWLEVELTFRGQREDR